MAPPTEGFTTANMDFASGKNEGYVRQITEWGSVMMLQEAKDFRLADKLPGSWKSLQNTDTEAKAGSCIGFDTDVWKVEDHWLTKACDEVKGADGMLARYIQTAILTHRESGKQAQPMSCHAPPPRFQDQRLDQFVTNLRKALGQVGKPVVGMDANFDVADVADKEGLQVFHVQTIIWVATNLKHRDSITRGWGPDHGASDHAALTCRLELVKA
jgi:hypothetical protein